MATGKVMFISDYARVFELLTEKFVKEMVMALGYFNEIPSWEDKKELARCINSLAIKKEYPICDNSVILELANKF